MESMDTCWKELIPTILRSYLHWKYPPSSEGRPPTDPTPPPQFELPPHSWCDACSTEAASDCESINVDPPADDDITAADVPPAPSDYDLELDCIDFFNPRSSVKIARTSRQTAAEALVCRGFLGGTPDKPTIAVSLDTLQLFYDIRQFKASYSVEAFTKMVCYKYKASTDALARLCTHGHAVLPDPIPEALPESNLPQL